MKDTATETEMPRSVARPVVAARPVGVAPIAANERIEVVDVLRGFAIFGILAVNMLWFAHPFHAGLAGTGAWSAPHDHAARWLIQFFCTNQFYMLFCLLFGFGAGVQIARADAHRVPFAPLYVRRLLVLLAIGIAHVVLLWAGDILITYALAGLLLPAFCRRSQKTLIAWALPSLLLGSIVMVGLLGLGRLVGGVISSDATTPAIAAGQSTTAPAKAGFAPDFQSAAAKAYDTYAHGTFGDIVVQRVNDYAFMLAITLLFMFGNVVGMFLVGLYTARRKVLHNPQNQLGFVRRVAVWGLVLGVPSNLAAVVLSEVTQSNDSAALSVLLIASSSVGSTALCLFYAAGIVLLVQRDRWRRRLQPLSAVGRMALSNYLMHSLICTTLFYSYGFGFFGKVGPALGLVLTCIIYAAQIPLSNWWLRRFRFGPVEWLWRSLTYGRRQPMRVALAS